MRRDKIFDFADEANYKSDEKIKVLEENHRNVKVKRIKIIDDSLSYHPKGNYLSFEINDLMNKKLSNNQISIINKHLSLLLKELGIKSNSHILMVGIGNDEFASDSLGPDTIKNISPNSYIVDINKKISCIIPGVLKMTGLESASIIRSLVMEYNFDLVIVFDALATTNIDRLYKVIQVTDTELIPGSGINNYRKSFNKEYLGTNLIAVGVSMVIKYASIFESFLDLIEDESKIKKYKKEIKKQLNNNFVFTSKDIEILTKQISENLGKIFLSLLQ